MSATTPARRVARRAIDSFYRESDLSWRWAVNPAQSLRFRTDGGDANLTQAGRDTVATLRRDGVALTNVEDLLGGTQLADAVRARVDGLIDDHSAEIAVRAAALRDPDPEVVDKPYLVELLGAMPAVRRDDPIAQFIAHPRVRGVAEAYSRMRLRVYDYNAWYNLANDGDATQSQRWHRDLPEDHDIVKVFLYVRDVPDGAGPLSYVTGSHTKSGRRIKLPETFDGIGYRIADEDIAKVADDSRVLTAPGPAGTVVFADTRGLHRGGWARTDDRVVVTGLYASKSCNRPGMMVAAPGESRDMLLPDFAVLSPDVARARAAEWA